VAVALHGHQHPLRPDFFTSQSGTRCLRLSRVVIFGFPCLLLYGRLKHKMMRFGDAGGIDFGLKAADLLVEFTKADF